MFDQNIPTGLAAALKHLSTQPPEVAKRVQEKWNKDYEEFTEAVRKEQKSTDPKDWATQSCKKCYGRGHTATLVQLGKAKTDQKIMCSCAAKNYRNWLKEFRTDFNRKRKERGNAE
jgi:RNase P subunit RPR2